MTERVEGEAWLCSICGFHPTSSGRWCDAGCGSDYREMTKLEGLPAIEIWELHEKADHYRSEVERLERELEGTREYAKEGWAWLDEALDALGVETVFGIKDAKERAEKAEAEAQHYREELPARCVDWAEQNGFLWRLEQDYPALVSS